MRHRSIAKVDPVETALATEHGMQPNYLSRGFEWDVNVIPSDQANAFCLPGGKMAVYTGLFPVAQNADAMAVVMGHEIAHALLRHGAQRMAQQKLTQIGQMAGAASGMDVQQQQMVMAAMGYGYLLPYARSHETQADEVGLMLAAAACYDPRAAIPLWERMEQSSGRAGAAGVFLHPSQSRNPHPEPAGVDAEGSGVPAALLPGGAGVEVTRGRAFSRARRAPPARAITPSPTRAFEAFRHCAPVVLRTTLLSSRLTMMA